MTGIHDTTLAHRNEMTEDELDAVAAGTAFGGYGNDLLNADDDHSVERAAEGTGSGGRGGLVKAICNGVSVLA